MNKDVELKVDYDTGKVWLSAGEYSPAELRKLAKRLNKLLMARRAEDDWSDEE